MPKTKISEFSTTPGDNTDINGINIAEGCAPSGINNAIRELMSDLKEWQSGAMDVYVVPQGTAAAPAVQFYADTDTGIYRYGANQVGVAVGGVSAGYFSSAGWNGNVNGTITGDINATTIDTTNLEVTNVKAKDGTAAFTIADSTGAVSVTTLLNVDNVRVDGNTVSATNTNGNLVLSPNGSGYVQATQEFRIDNLTMYGSFIGTTNTNGSITIAPNGTGDVLLETDTVRVGDQDLPAIITTYGTGRLTLNTNAGTNSGSIVINAGANANIAITPNGTGEVTLPKVNIDAGTIDGTVIGGASAAAGTFTTLSATGNVTVGDASGDSLTINASTASVPNGLNFDSNTFVIDATNDRVGIGTATPSRTLHVTGSSGLPGITVESTSASGSANPVVVFNRTTTTATALQFVGSANWTHTLTDASTATAAQIYVTANNNAGSNTGTLYQNAKTSHIFQVDGTEIFRGTSSGFQVTNIRAKDGTASITLADATGVATFSANPILNAGTANGVLYLNGSKVATSGSAVTYDGTTFTTTGAANFATSSGNVGIGTASPTAKLQVSQSSSGATVRGRIDNTSTGASSAADLIVNAGSANSYIQLQSIIAAAGSLYFGADLTSGNINVAGAYPLILSTSNTERMRIDSSGNLGIGVTPSAWGSNFKATQIGNYGAFIAGQTGQSQVFVGTNAYFDGTNWRYINASQASRYYQNAGSHVWESVGAGSAGATFTFSQAMTLNASGNLGIGTTSPTEASLQIAKDGVASGAGWTTVLKATDTSNNKGFQFGYDASTQTSILVANTSSAASNLAFWTYTGAAWGERARITSGGDLLVGTTSSSNTVVGVRVIYNASNPYITNTCAASTNAATSYNLYSTGASAFRFYVDLTGTIFATNTTISAISDQRLKENIRDLDAGLDKIMALKPRKFDWKAGKGKDKKDDRGFIAQEFEQVFPDLIDTWKDPAPEGEEPYKSVRQDLIPVLVKAIQEQQAMINELKAEVAALKGA